ncbi:MAG: SPOR domain-containing protein [Polaromonas sp.]|uniref:SPOR domain-containing protein n=1 Tax=Polaromonas sp. TaxID=1869339 RepID=UPI0025DE6A06|nr:SPOR domain-containing protein [Polaromonas sp.]MBI2726913.1 SPOR domain-containing protein [Polaromonas sp.]
MSFFNFRRAGSSSAANAAANAQPESVDVIRRRAKHRLIGAAVLVLAGVVGFPLLFDTQPRPIAVDIPIEIPGKNAVKPLVMAGKQDPVAAAPVAPAPAVAEAKPAAAPPTPAQEKVAAASSLGAKEEIVSDKKPASAAAVAKPEAKTEVKAEAKPAPKPEVKPEPKPAAAASSDGARAKALLEGKTAAPSAAPASASAAEGRMVVQVGAFADVAKAREVRLKLEKAGLKTYTQVAETKDGKRIRVRVGPFATKAEADKAASKIKSLDLPASILTL